MVSKAAGFHHPLHLYHVPGRTYIPFGHSTQRYKKTRELERGVGERASERARERERERERERVNPNFCLSYFSLRL